MTVAPSGPVIGAEVSGLDLREPLTSELRDELRRLLLQHRVLFLRDQQIDTGQQVAFAEGFGDVLVFRTGSDPHPVYPGVDQMGVHQLHPVPPGAAERDVARSALSLAYRCQYPPRAPLHRRGAHDHRPDPETGEKHLFLNSVLASSVVGMAPQASDDLIATLTREYDRPDNQVRFEWSPGTEP